MSNPVAGTHPIVRRRKVTSQRNRHGLISYARDRTSQNGEDGIIQRIFELMPPNSHESNGHLRRICVDVGAWDGKHLSNTFSLLVPKGCKVSPHEGKDERQKTAWSGILIEADKRKFLDLQRLHRPLGNHCLNVEVSCVEDSPEGLARVLRQFDDAVLPLNFDFLCIDVDGSDYWLMSDLLASEYTPKVLCVEFNPSMPDDLVYIPMRSDTVRHGASLSALVEVAHENGYVLIETTLYNAFFVHFSYYETYFKESVPDTSIEALHEVTMGSSLFQLYDGTLKLWGCKKLLWHRIPIDEAKLQPLPLESRQFPFAPSTSSDDEYDPIYEQAIDVSSYCGMIESDAETREKRRQCSLAFISQLKQDGFCYIRGTGISSALCQNALSQTRAFLHDAEEDVRRSCLAKDRARRGYSPINTENFASLIGAKGPNDLVRKFRIGPRPCAKKVDFDEISASHTTLNVQSERHSKKNALLQENVWPSSELWSEQASQEFKSSLEEYYDRCCSVARCVVGAICDGLVEDNPDLEPSISGLTFAKLSGGSTMAHTSILTLLGYRSGSRHRIKARSKKKIVHPLVASHTDVGVVTMLLFDGGNCASLQRIHKTTPSTYGSSSTDEGIWVKVPLPPIANDPVFVVNIADCLSDLSHGILPSTLHRVVPERGNVPRNCLALFMGLDPNQEIVLKDGCVLTYEQWRKRRIASSQDVLKRAGGGLKTI